MCLFLSFFSSVWGREKRVKENYGVQDFTELGERRNQSKEEGYFRYEADTCDDESGGDNWRLKLAVQTPPRHD